MPPSSDFLTIEVSALYCIALPCIALLLCFSVARYFIDYRNTDQDKKFKVDKATGEVQLRNQLDYEVETVHNVHILAIDKGRF